MNLKTEITKIHYNCNPKGLLYLFLLFCSNFYKIISNIRNYFYDKGLIKSEKVDAFVISVGNLTTGGVGKTPVVAEIAKYFLAKGEKVAIISRGYGGKLSSKNINLITDGEEVFYDANDAGDEPYWYTQNLKGVVVVTSSSRVNAANFAIKKFAVTKIILDDGFQHRKIKRDMDIVLIDSEKRLGNEKLLPAGPLREGVASLKRADKIIVVNKGSADYNALFEYAKSLDAQICDVAPAEVYNIKTGVKLPSDISVAAMCAIGQPEQFFNFLSPQFNIIKKIIFDDHHSYVKSDFVGIDIPIITTEKDAVKIKLFELDNIYALKLRLNINCEGLFSDRKNS